MSKTRNELAGELAEFLIDQIPNMPAMAGSVDIEAGTLAVAAGIIIASCLEQITDNEARHAAGRDILEELISVTNLPFSLVPQQ